MYSSKSTLLTVFAAYCISYAMAQLDKYEKLSEKDLTEKCGKNGMAELEKVNEEVWTLFLDNYKEIPIEEARKTDGKCMGPTAKDLLEKEMKIVQNCLQGKISLSDEETNSLANQSIKKLCNLLRLGSFEVTMSGCIDANKQFECEEEVKKKYGITGVLENDAKFSNIGLTYSQEGHQAWYETMVCASKSYKNCDPKQMKTHKELIERMKDSMKVRN